MHNQLSFHLSDPHSQEMYTHVLKAAERTISLELKMILRETLKTWERGCEKITAQDDLQSSVTLEDLWKRSKMKQFA